MKDQIMVPPLDGNIQLLWWSEEILMTWEVTPYTVLNCKMYNYALDGGIFSMYVFK